MAVVVTAAATSGVVRNSFFPFWEGQADVGAAAVTTIAMYRAVLLGLCRGAPLFVLAVIALATPMQKNLWTLKT